jgi:hypothetical protein
MTIQQKGKTILSDIWRRPLKNTIETTNASNRKRQAMCHKNHILMSYGANGSVIKISHKNS